jgi:O-antigen ligase/Flp pilus assembly protein TadD
MIIKKTARFISLAALFLIPIFPLIVANSYYFPFITGKAFFFRILVEVAFASWLILAAIDARYRPKLTSLTVAVSVFALITLVADLLGVNPLRSMWSNFERMEGWMTIIHLWAFYMVATNIFGSGEEGRRAWHRFLNAELLVAFVVGLYGIGQLAGWFAIHQGSTRIDASLGNAAYMAVYMLMNAGLAAYMFFGQKKNSDKGESGAFLRFFYAVISIMSVAGLILSIKFFAVFALVPSLITLFVFDLVVIAWFVYLWIKKPHVVPHPIEWMYAVLVALFAYEVFETATRGTILGLAGAIMLACLLYAIFARNGSKASRWSAVGVIVLIIVLGAALYGSRNTDFVKNHEVFNRLASISWSESQGQARNYVWPMAIKGFTQRPILGWGQENFNYIFNANYDPRMWNQEQWFDRAHSVYLDWLVASGVIGLLAYLSLYVLSIVGIWRSSLTVAEKSVLTGMIAGYAVHNFFVFDNLASYLLFFTSLAFINSLKEGREIRWLGQKSLSAEAVEYIVSPVAIVALVASVYFFNVRPIEANTRLIAGLVACSGPSADPALFQNALDVKTYVANQEIREQILSCAISAIGQPQVPNPTKEAFYKLAVQSIQDQIAATPLKDARIYALGGSFYSNLSQFDKSVELLETAHKLSPAKQSIDLELANGYINSNQVGKAVELLGPAYESAKNNTQVASVYALALVVDGKEAKAHEIFGNDPAIFQTVGMAQAYAYIKQYTKAVAIYQALLAANPTDMNLGVQLAQTQYKAGMLSASIATLRDLEKSHPEYKTQIEAAIQQVQSGK